MCKKITHTPIGCAKRDNNNDDNEVWLRSEYFTAYFPSSPSAQVYIHENEGEPGMKTFQIFHEKIYSWV